jgi:tetratricopeptide (TPR) repeat protein
MFRVLVFLLLAAGLSIPASSQMQQLPPSDQGPGASQAPPRYEQDKERERERDKEAGESSSRDTKIDITPPKDDEKSHPTSTLAVSEAEADHTDVSEFHPFNPQKAAKDVEVGDFYFKRKNYRAALARYQDALLWKNNHAEANFRMAQCLEKLDNPEEAVVHYQEYLKILPQGPLSKEARKELEKLKGKSATANAGDTQSH